MLRQESETPALVAFGCRTAGQGDKMSFLLTIELTSIVPIRRLAVECPVQAIKHVFPANPGNGVWVNFHGIGNLFVGPARTEVTLVSLQEHPGMGQGSRCCNAAREQGLKALPLCL